MLKVLVAGALALACSFAATAAPPPAKKPLGQWTCEDFVAVEDQFKPKVVYWASAYSKSGKPEAALLDIDGTETVTPAIVDACVKNPKASFWQTLQGEWKKAEAAAAKDMKKLERDVKKAEKSL